MKKLLMILAVLILGTIVPFGGTQAQEAQPGNIVYAGCNYEGNFGAFVGAGLSLGKVSLMPYTRIAFERAETSEWEFEKSLGVEVAYFVYEYYGWRFGVLANLADVNWLQNQQQEIGIYLGQAAGGIITKDLTANVGLAAWGRAKAQLFDPESLFKDRFTVGLAVFAKM
jgi:hypothetical protein